MFGQGYEEIGSSDKGLILKSTGNVKIQWGKKFINLLDKDGNINSPIKNIIKSISSVSDMKDNGFYIVEGVLYAKAGVNIIEIVSGENGNTFVSFMSEQKTSSENKYKALKNIGLIYPKQSISNIYPTKGIIYFEDSKSLYIVNNGSLEKYQIELPQPYTKTFVISKNSEDNTEGAIVIEGTGIDNCLRFNTLRIYSEGQNATINFNKELTFNIENNKVASINISGIETFGIQSIGADKNIGFRIQQTNNKYTLDIDKINVRESSPLEPIKVNLPTKSFNKENIIVDSELITTSNSTKYKFSFKYENTYQVGDIIRTYTEVQLEGDPFTTLIPLQFQITEITQNTQEVKPLYAYATSISYIIQETSDNIPKLYKIITENGVEVARFPRYWKVQNAYCYLVSNNGTKNHDLVTGEIDSTDRYNDKKNGLISKQNILYSAKFDKEGTGATVFPFYSPELEAELENHYNETAYENVIPTIKIIKRLIAGT